MQSMSISIFKFLVSNAYTDKELKYIKVLNIKSIFLKTIHLELR